MMGGFPFFAVTGQRYNIVKQGPALILDITDHGVADGIDVTLKVADTGRVEFETIVLDPDFCFLQCLESKTASVFWKCLHRPHFLREAKSIRLRLNAPLEDPDGWYSRDTLSREQRRFIHCQKMAEDIADDILTFAPEFIVETINVCPIGQSKRNSCLIPTRSRKCPIYPNSSTQASSRR